MPKSTCLVTVLAAVCLVLAPVSAQRHTPSAVMWGSDVPKGWHGTWPVSLQTVSERSRFARVSDTSDLLEFVSALKWRSEFVHVFPVYTSALGKIAPAVVLARPRITSPAEALVSGKVVVYLQGNIHPPEPEGTEALLMVMRDVLLGDRQHLLDNQILIVCPAINMDGTDMRFVQDGMPSITGSRVNARGLDLNRDAVRLESPEITGLYQNVLNKWDPALFVDLHLMGDVTHGYANTYATSTVPAAHPAPRAYLWDTLFPAVREAVRRDFGIETFSHALPDRVWPPTVWSHDNAIWSTEAKFVVADYGLRNRMSIITETPGSPSFEKRVYAQYAYVLALLGYTNAHAAEMLKVVREADADTVSQVSARAGTGSLRNWLQGKYESWGKTEILAYPSVEMGLLPGTSVSSAKPGQAIGQPQRVTVENMTKPVGTRDAVVPRAYVLPPTMSDVVVKLRAHNIRVQTIDAASRVEGDQFVINGMSSVKSWGYSLTVLDGGYFGPSATVVPAGSFLVDMAQPMANAAFYYLEPQAADGFVAWGLLDEHLRRLGVAEHAVVYPIFKCRQLPTPAA
jgi:hypothetical protein